MNQNDVKRYDQERIFVGKITAGLSHEIMNILAVIRERSGLIEDLMALNPETPFPFRARLAKTLTSIGEQVTRGIAIGKKLNRFAHTMDETITRVAIDELIELSACLMEPFARRKKIRLKTAPVDPPFELETDPFQLLLVLGACNEFCMERIDAGGEITLQRQNRKQGMAVEWTLNPEGFDGDAPERVHVPILLGDVLKSLGARLDFPNPPHQTGLVLVLPPS